jgi:hypothetical protein
MFRIAIVSGITLLSVVAANAGQIQIGGANGLTTSTVTGGNCTTGGPCTLQGYVPVLFENVPVTAPTGPGTLTDPTSGVVFSDINAGPLKNFWDLPTLSSGSSVLTIPIGLFGVTDVWTMINDIEGTNTRDVTVVFNFGTTANASTVVAKSVQLNDANPSQAGQVENALVCNSGCAETSQGTLTGMTSGAITVLADNVFSQPFNIPCISSSITGTGGTSACGAQGTAYLGDQGFFFNGAALGGSLGSLTNLNTYLVSVQVKEISSVGGGSALTAITVDQVPEPSTVLLFVAGLGALGLGRLRKKA